MTVRDVLALPVMARGVPEVIEDGEGLDGPIRWVHAGEAANISELLKGGELLLSTGIGIGTGQSEQRRFVAELADREIAALVLELGARFREVPAPMVDEARQRSLALIVLHREIPFVEVTEAVHREIVGRQFELLRRGDELHRQFTSLMLAGAGIPEVLAELATAVRNPVVLEKADAGILYHARHRADDESVLAGWDSFVRRLPNAPDAIEQHVPTGPDGEQWGRLVALALDEPLDRWARVAVERALGLIAVALLRDRAEEAVSSRERGNFLAGLLEREVDEAEARRRAIEMGFPDRRGAMLPIAVARSPAPGPPPGSGEAESLSRVWRALLRELEGRRAPALAGTRAGEHELLLIIGLRDERGRDETADLVAAALAEAAERHLGAADATVASVGPVATSWRGVGAGLRRAVGGLEGASRSRSRPWYDATQPDLEVMLWKWRDNPELRSFVAARLGPLLEHDRGRQSKLLPTLAAFCRHGGRKTETARALHIERQTLYHRLARIEDVLEVDLADGDAVLGLHLAIRAHEQLDA